MHVFFHPMLVALFFVGYAVLDLRSSPFIHLQAPYRIISYHIIHPL